MKISFYKPHQIAQGNGAGNSQERHRTQSPDTYHNITNLVIFSDGMVMFRNESNETIASTLPYKIVADTDEDVSSIQRRVL